MKKAIELIGRTTDRGIKIQIAGRLNGSEMARVEWAREGRVPPKILAEHVALQLRNRVPFRRTMKKVMNIGPDMRNGAPDDAYSRTRNCGITLNIHAGYRRDQTKRASFVSIGGP